MFYLDVTKIIRKKYQPTKIQIQQYIQSAIIKKYLQVFINVSIVSEIEIQNINFKYRDKNQATNVIALEYPNEDTHNYLYGDIILCDKLIVEEAVAQSKTILSHYAHLIIHATLHLQGYTHNNVLDSKEMETLEINILHQYGFSNPYIIK